MYTTDQLDGMNKAQLRSACRDHKVSGYSKMTVKQMRAALPTGNGDDPAAREETTAAKLSDAFLKAAGAEDAITTPTPRRQPKKVPPAADNLKRPKAGGKCAEVWTFLDANPATTLKEIKAVAVKRGWSVGNASQEIYAWRRAHGITGRVKA